MGVSHVTVSKTLQRLAREGYVTYRPYRSIFLTEAGKQFAAATRERHRLVLELLSAQVCRTELQSKTPKVWSITRAKPHSPPFSAFLEAAWGNNIACACLTQTFPSKAASSLSSAAIAILAFTVAMAALTYGFALAWAALHHQPQPCPHQDSTPKQLESCTFFVDQHDSNTRKGRRRMAPALAPQLME